jgi:hypothetical protein
LIFFKGKNEEQPPTRNKYWSLTTNNGEINDPTLEQIETAIKNAHSNATLFATLAYNHSNLEIEAVQTVSYEGVYRVEALTSHGIMYVKNDIQYEETLKLFEDYFKYQRVSGFRSWPTEKY